MNCFIHYTGFQGSSDLGFIGFSELLEELEAIAALQGTPRNQALQELATRKGLSVFCLCHILAIMQSSKSLGGAA